MASASGALEELEQLSTGRQVRSKQDVARLLMQVRKREEALKSVQRKLAIREKRVREAEKKTKKRSDFLDAWEVSLKSKEAELTEERKEIENIKSNLRKLGESILDLSDKADSIYDDIPYEEEVVEEISLEEEPEEKKPILGFLKGKPKKVEKPSKPVRRPMRTSAAQGGRTLRELLEEKREKLRSTSGEPSDPLAWDEPEEAETYECPVCGAEVSSNDKKCHGCSVDLTW